MTLKNIDIVNIIVMRNLGFYQDEIGNHIGVSQKTVGDYLLKLNEQAKQCKNDNELYILFWKNLLGDSAISLIKFIFNNININK